MTTITVNVPCPSPLARRDATCGYEIEVEVKFDGGVQSFDPPTHCEHGESSNNPYDEAAAAVLETSIRDAANDWMDGYRQYLSGKGD